MKTYRNQIEMIRNSLVSDIIKLLSQHGLTCIKIPKKSGDAIFIIWIDDESDPHECHVTEIMIWDDYLIFTAVDCDNNIYDNIDSRWHLGGRNLDWVNEIYERIQFLLHGNDR